MSSLFTIDLTFWHFYNTFNNCKELFTPFPYTRKYLQYTGMNNSCVWVESPLPEKAFSLFYTHTKLESYLVDNYHRPPRSRRLLPAKTAGLAEVRLR